MRCTPLDGTAQLLMSILSEQDAGALRRIVYLEDVDHYFDVERHYLRSRCTVRTKSVARTDLIKDVFSWKVCSKTNKGDIPRYILLSTFFK